MLQLIYLAWAPLSPYCLKRFADSYRAVDAGTDHRLTVIFKQFEDSLALDSARHALGPLEYDEVHYRGKGLDLESYRDAAREMTGTAFCFLNSTASDFHPQWLGLMDRATSERGVGLVGATGSFQSLHKVDWRLPDLPLHKRFALELAVARRRAHHRREWPAFPNPHIRTNGFLIPHEVFDRLRWPNVREKHDAYRLESGVSGLSAQVRRLGLDLALVGRDGRAFAPAEWPESGTFWSHAQRNLLLADNRTRDYDAAGVRERERLRRQAWAGDP